MNLFEPEEPISDARISECGRYRYLLRRIWDRGAPLCAWVMLNPSTADGAQDDPTIRKCVGFAKRWRFGGIVVANCFAFRATDPKELRAVPDPYGPENDEALLRLGGCLVGRIVVAWGVNCRWGRGRTKIKGDTRALVTMQGAHPVRHKKIVALRVTKGGYPQHPLYVPYAVEPVPYLRTPA